MAEVSSNSALFLDIKKGVKKQSASDTLVVSPIPLVNATIFNTLNILTHLL